jgi:muconolactone D-isomerase
MEFLVQIELTWPADGSPDQRAEIVAAEQERSRELASAGRLRRLWRVPGERANWGLWEAADATELHAALASLPFFPWMRNQVQALAAHPNDPERPGGS